MPGHPNQSGHIKMSIEKCYLDANSEGPYKQTHHSEDPSIPPLLASKWYLQKGK